MLPVGRILNFGNGIIGSLATFLAQILQKEKFSLNMLDQGLQKKLDCIDMCSLFTSNQRNSLLMKSV